MGVERERKFILSALPDLKRCEKYSIIQKYLGTRPELRVRKINGNCLITKKGEGTHTRTEEEMEISEELFRFLGGYEKEASIRKDRYKIPLGDGLVAELDIYHGSLKGLYSVEVEFDSHEEMMSFSPPEWFGKEVTHREDLTNYSIATTGLPEDIREEITVQQKGEK